MLQNADPTGESCPDPPELAALEGMLYCLFIVSLHVINNLYLYIYIFIIYLHMSKT